MNFREFLEKKEKVWQAAQDDILKYWATLPPNMPLQMEPISRFHKGRRFDVDGLRITGSSEFIGSVLSKMKEILNHHSGVKLDVRYQQVKKTQLSNNPKFQCYVHLLAKQ